jgi:hypothetical protein
MRQTELDHDRSVDRHGDRRGVRIAAAEWSEAQGGRARNFMAWLGVGSGLIFALVILNQLTAALMISPCLR